MWSFIDSEIKWNFDDNSNDLLIQYWNEDTNVQGDFSIQWYDLHDEILIPKLEIFEDSWLALYQYGQEFLKMLAENNNKMLTKEEMKSELLKIGFIDRTTDEV